MIGQKLGSYLIQKELGAGAMGVVHKGVHTEKNWEVAIKTLHREVLARGGTVLDRFLREITLLEQFCHPNIVRYLAKGRYQGVNYFVMEYLPGVTLDQLIKDEGPFEWPRAVNFAIQICSALEYAHERNVIHRDLKPSNLMVDKGDEAKLTDFGIAKALDETALTAPGRTLGTAAYMALEQITGSPEVSHKTDLYALGIVIYEMLTKETPYKGPTIPLLLNQHLTQDTPRVSKLGYYIPKALDELIVRLMAKSPSDRPFDAGLVKRELEQLMERRESGQPIKMVGNKSDGPESEPDRSHMTLAADKPKLKAKAKAKTKAKAKSKVKKQGTLDDTWGEPEEGESRLQLVGLVAGLVLVGGLIGYFVWPPSENYLFTQGEKLMATNERTDWMIAKDQYLDPLDARFPNHSRKKQTDLWRDKLGLAHAVNRADLMRTAKDDLEQIFLDTQKLAKDAFDRGDDRESVKLWREMEKKLVAKAHPERGWGLLADKRAEEAEKGMADRRKELASIIERADDLESRMLTDQATALRREALTKYGKFTDLSDVIPVLQTKIPAEGGAVRREP